MCGIFGIFNYQDAAATTALGLHALQHRGQEAAGIVSFDGASFYAHKDMGHVGDIFGTEDVIKKLKGRSALGHVRYSTSGEKFVRNTQPLYAHLDFGGIGLAHNGNLTNAIQLRKELVLSGAIFQSTSDTEVILHLIAKSQEKTLEDRVVEALNRVVGAYALIMILDDKMIVARDPHGVRPLVMGELDGAAIFASESIALDIIGAKLVRDVKPGEIITISQGETKSFFPFPKVPPRLDIFEYIYFSRPDSILEGKPIYDVRLNIGRELARECLDLDHNVDVIVPVPDSGVPAALGYAKETGVPFDYGIIRNHYVGRTFIEPTAQIRNLGVKLKHNPNASVLKGKSVVLVDDSIVRGTTSRKIVEMVRNAGAKEIHFRVACPPTAWPCFYGIDTPNRKELLSASHTPDEICKTIGADSLKFLSVDGMYRAIGEESRNNETPQYEDSVYTGDYPVPLIDYEDGSLDEQLSLLQEAG